MPMSVYLPGGANNLSLFNLTRRRRGLGRSFGGNGMRLARSVAKL
eukprot:CAMPEP_0174752268 /NCGR_PEP_ID=MMETSP1094-20130205/101678_1 /TAXON_ID=156173 /ORGANISM="Chrysochromulina brevifilum, Strain UTEX LB 985" /LENGTH=44 /DNA_ID= /DNA_START= /DNA_END= /DNA_ORIENTATION=